MIKDTAFYQTKTLNLDGKLVLLENPVVMGILNHTPDSFYDGGRYNNLDDMVKQASNMLTDGALIVDVGGASSRPGAIPVDPKEERMRVVPVIKALKKELGCFISVDTCHPEVAAAAVDEGANMINDVSGSLFTGGLLNKLEIPYVCMHMRGNPQKMQQLSDYEDVILDIFEYFSEKIAKLFILGIHDVIIDPGFGFSKNTQQNFRLLNHLSVFKALNKPIMVGVSRKSMIYKTLGCTPEQALNGTSVLHTLALERGANILRVHDVKPAVEAIKLYTKTII